ncbi:MAG: hypothetical protein HEQ23_04080 [Tepidisphaera sp.]
MTPTNSIEPVEKRLPSQPSNGLLVIGLIFLAFNAFSIMSRGVSGWNFFGLAASIGSILVYVANRQKHADALTERKDRQPETELNHRARKLDLLERELELDKRESELMKRLEQLNRNAAPVDRNAAADERV